MNLLLIRHAIAEDRDPRRWPEDEDRPLTQRGIRRFRPAAIGLGTLAAEVDQLITSPFVRAHQTATILEDQLGWPAPDVRPHLAGGAPIAGAIALLGACEPRSRVAVVGHEPMMSQLAAAYAGSTSASFSFDWRRGGVACIEFEQAAQINRGSLRWFLPPRVLRALGEA
jgi:phosphohistidine phosphatase